MGLFDDLDMVSGQVNKKPKDRDIVRAAFGYPGGKSRSVKKILPHLPYRERYIEPFGGSAAILLAREPSKLEVYNDRYAGVVAFYRCLRSKKLFDALVQWIELTVHSREEFVFCRDTWENVDDPVERAGRWYYMSMYSFGSIGRNWGRSTSAKGNMAGKIRRKLKLFPAIHQRFERVQVENQDWEDCVRDYDSPDAVFYLDPPYVDVNRGTYGSEMSIDDHRHFLEVVMSLKGFCAVSGYSNPLYEKPPWDDRHEWKSFVSIQSMAYTEGNRKEQLKGLEKRGHATEVLWIKEAQK